MVLNVIGEGRREALEPVVDIPLPAGSVLVGTFAKLHYRQGLPRRTRLDKAPEMLARLIIDWCEKT